RPIPRSPAPSVRPRHRDRESWGSRWSSEALLSFLAPTHPGGCAVLGGDPAEPPLGMRPCCERLRSYDISCSQLVKMYREAPTSRAAAGGGRGGGGAGLAIVVRPREPAGQPVDRRLRVGVHVDELAQPLRQPAQRDLVVAAPLREFLKAAVGEVHRTSPSIRG